MAPLTRRAFLAHSALASLAATTARAEAPARIPIGQIGTAHAHAGGKWGTIRKSPDFEVVGLVESDPARCAAAEKSAAWADAPWMTEAELLAYPGLRAVCVETEVKELLPTAARCVAAGLHVHLDKPPGESLSAFRALRVEAERRQLTLQMGYMFRHQPAFELGMRLVREGALGEIFSIEAAMSKNAGAGERAHLLAYRGGTMFELGCHLIDSVVRVLGKPEKVTPFARSTRPDGFLDNQTAVLEYPGALATVRTALVEHGGETRRQFTLCGSKGTYEIRPLEPAQIHLYLDEAHGEYKAGGQEIVLPKGGGRYDGDFALLARAIRGEVKFPFSAEHDLAVQEAVLRASGLAVD